MIQGIWRKLKEEWYLFAVIILIALLAFGIGRLSALYGQESDFKVMMPSQVDGEGRVLGASQGSVPADTLTTVNSASSGAYVASKTGSKYHLPWCAGARSIKEENKVYFATKEEAEARGYEPAANCKGI